MPLIYLRPSQKTDVPAIMAILTKAKKLLAADQIDQWQNGYPNVEQIQADIQQQISWVLMVNQTIAATAALMLKPEPTYQDIRQGHWHNSQPYATIHRIAVDPQLRGQRLSTILLSNLVTVGLQQQRFNFRVDTHPQNLRMQHVVQQAGFQKRGEIQVTDGLRWAYELNLPVIKA